MTMTVHYHDPRAALPTAPLAYTLGADFSQPLTLGLLANGFPDSVEFLDAVEAALGEHQPGLTIRRYNKGNPSIPATAALLAQIAGECQVVASAYGH
jgi:hypothetical protein